MMADEPTHVFAGTPDGRQAAELDMQTSRFRPRYRALSDDEKKLHDVLKDQAEVLARTIESIKPGRYRSLAITALEESIMWAVKELTA